MATTQIPLYQRSTRPFTLHRKVANPPRNGKKIVHLSSFSSRFCLRPSESYSSDQRKPVMSSNSVLCCSLLNKDDTMQRRSAERYHPARDIICIRSGLKLPKEADSYVKFAIKIAAGGLGVMGIGIGIILLNGIVTMASAYKRGMGTPLSASDGNSNGGGGQGGDTGGGGDGDSGDWGEDKAGGKLAMDSERQKEEEGAPVTVVVPVLNEESCIAETVYHLQQLNPAPHRIIVVDGGSSDQTVAIAKQGGAMTVASDRGRATQLNRGARAAMEDPQFSNGIICFVHADTKVPYDLVTILRQSMKDSSTICGGFVPIAAVPGQILWGMSLQNVTKTWYAPLLLRPVSFLQGIRCLFGDQAMFCRAEDFRAVGGFDEKLAIMEDANLCERLHAYGLTLKEKRGRIQLVNRTVVTSGRRLVKWGPLKSTYIHYVIGLSYALGASPEEIMRLYAKFYNDVR